MEQLSCARFQNGIPQRRFRPIRLTQTGPPNSPYARLSGLTLTIPAACGLSLSCCWKSSREPPPLCSLALRLHFAAPCGPSRKTPSGIVTKHRSRTFQHWQFSFFSPRSHAPWAAPADSPPLSSRLRLPYHRPLQLRPPSTSP